jgi:hypothetical protein
MIVASAKCMNIWIVLSSYENFTLLRDNVFGVGLEMHFLLTCGSYGLA